MAVWIRTSCSRTLMAGALLLAALSSRAHADYRIDIDAGIDRAYRANTWTPAYVRLSGAGADADGQVRILTRLRNGTVRIYAKPARLHTGATSDAYMLEYLQPDPAEAQEVVAQVLADGRVIQQKKVEGILPLQENQLAIVGLTQDQGGLSYLVNVDLGLNHRLPMPQNNPYGYGGAPGMGNRPRTPTRVLYPRPATLPDSPGGWKAADAVMLGDLALDSLSEDQWNALEGWVRDGGTLVVSGGADINRVRSQKLSDILPIVPTTVRQMRSLPSLADRYNTAGPRLVSTPVIVGTLRPDAMALCREGDVAVVSVRRVGNGAVFFTAFDLQAPEFRAWPGQAALWQEILQLGAPELRATEILRSANQPVHTYYWGGQDTSEARSLRDALAGVQATEAPNFMYIGGFLLLYILCLVPVNYFLLKRRDKRELAWITAPAIILLFSTGAYAVGYSIKGGQLYLRYGSVIEGSANDDAWSAYSVASIFSPRQARYNVSIGDPAALPMEVLEDNAGFDRPTFDIDVLRGQRTVVQSALVNMWDHRCYDFESHLSLGGKVDASVVPAGGDMVKVQVTNGMPFALTDCQVALQGNVAPVGNLAPGASTTVRIRVGASQSQNGLMLQVGQSQQDDTVSRIRQAMGNILVGNPGGAQGTQPMVFTGWFGDPVLGLALDGEQPTVQGTNLLVVHLTRPGSTGVSPPPFTPVQPPLPGQTGSPLGAPPTLAGGNAMSHNQMAYQWANQGDLNRAMQEANRALALAPQDGTILDTVGEMHQRRKEYAAAAKYYVQALKYQGQPGLPETHEKYGETLLALGRRKEAVAQLRLAAKGGGPYGGRAQALLQRLAAKR